MNKFGFKWLDSDEDLKNMEKVMVGDKLKRILQSQTDLSDEQIAVLSEAEGWALVYANARKLNALKKTKDCKFALPVSVFQKKRF